LLAELLPSPPVSPLPPPPFCFFFFLFFTDIGLRIPSPNPGPSLPSLSGNPFVRRSLISTRPFRSSPLLVVLFYFFPGFFLVCPPPHRVRPNVLSSLFVAVRFTDPVVSTGFASLIFFPPYFFFGAVPPFFLRWT